MPALAQSDRFFFATVVTFCPRCDSGMIHVGLISKKTLQVEVCISGPTNRSIRVRSRNSLPHFAHSAGQRECRNCTRHEAHDCITSRSVRPSCITSVCAYVLRLPPIDTAADDSGGTVGKNACDAIRGSRPCRELRQCTTHSRTPARMYAFDHAARI